jgi:hypothetical protein
MAKNDAEKRYFDAIAADSAIQLDLLTQAKQRLLNVQNLQGLIVSALDPKEKQDLANRLAAEQAAIAADANVITLYKETRTQQLAELETSRAAAAQENYRLNRCRSYAIHPEFISQASLDKYKCK